MRAGHLQQVAAPQVLYSEPANLFVAEFIGSPAMNLVEATLESSHGELDAVFGGNRLRIDAELAASRPALQAYAGGRIGLGIRPEDLEDASMVEAPPERRIAATVDIREDMGSEVFLHFLVPAKPVDTAMVREALEPEAREAIEALADEQATPFVARVSRETSAREQERVELAVDARRLHFFDLESGQGIYLERGARMQVGVAG
jgi:multiple sugar transport system ATP-binding protein